jgi:hypothetical protein
MNLKQNSKQYEIENKNLKTNTMLSNLFLSIKSLPLTITWTSSTTKWLIHNNSKFKTSPMSFPISCHEH